MAKKNKGKKVPGAPRRTHRGNRYNPRNEKNNELLGLGPHRADGILKSYVQAEREAANSTNHTARQRAVERMKDLQREWRECKLPNKYRHQNGDGKRMLLKEALEVYKVEEVTYCSSVVRSKGMPT